MKTTDLHQEFIADEFNDLVKLASRIIGFKCCDTVMHGDSEKGDDIETKYQITPDAYSTSETKDRINLIAFEDYFYDNYGKWKERCYFDSPSQAFAAIIKAWDIWNNHIEREIKEEYFSSAEENNNGQ